MPAEVNAMGAVVDADLLPKWFATATLDNAAREQVGEENFDRVVSITPLYGTKPGDNYASLMLRLAVQVQLKDGSSKSISFMLKVLHSNEAMAQVLGVLQVFTKEEQMYNVILKRFEKLYSDAGKSVQLAPKSFKFDRDPSEDYILLEDLRERQFRNQNRLQGLDMEHLKQALTKLAEFHAASACYVEHFGLFPEEFTKGFVTEANRELLKQFNDFTPFLNCLKKWKNCSAIYEKLKDTNEHVVDVLIKLQKLNSNEFNVLNHSDAHINNIMFQHDAFGKIKNTYFIDFQICKYGSPAYDLYYLILSSAAKEIRIAQFDYLIRFYYDNLIENLKLLQYHRPLPKLCNIHANLLRAGLPAYMICATVLPAMMLEKLDNATMEEFTKDATKMKMDMYSNPKYVQVMAEILPWLDNRGLLDWM